MRAYRFTATILSAVVLPWRLPPAIAQSYFAMEPCAFAIAAATNCHRWYYFHFWRCSPRSPCSEGRYSDGLIHDWNAGARRRSRKCAARRASRRRRPHRQTRERARIFPVLYRPKVAPGDLAFAADLPRSRRTASARPVPRGCPRGGSSLAASGLFSFNVAPAPTILLRRLKFGVTDGTASFPRSNAWFVWQTLIIVCCGFNLL